MDPITATESLPVGRIVMELFGGLAVFLFGMEQMTNALKLIAGQRMKTVLAKLTSNRFRGVVAGATVTSIIQSSSVTTVLVVGFISAGLMTFQQSIGVILGADIGTTITAQVVAFKVTKYALLLVAVGFALQFLLKREIIKHWGSMIMGLGLIFFGMQLMSDGTSPMRTYEPFINVMRQMDNPALGILVAAVFTGLIQSSSATIGVVIVLAGQGFVSLEAGIALAFGANIGTCVTALLASIGKPREAVRASVVHILFKVVGVLIWVGFIGSMAQFVRWISPSSPELDGAARLAADTPRQIANAHTLFNVANTFIFIGFTGPLAKLMTRLVPDRPAGAASKPPDRLDEILLQTPALALDLVRMELGRAGAAALHMVQQTLDAIVDGSRAQIEALEKMDNEVDRLHAGLIAYLRRLSQQNLNEEQSALLQQYLAAAKYIENIGDMIETNLVEAGMDRLKHGVKVSPSTRTELAALHKKVCWAVERSIEALVSADASIGKEVVQAKQEITALGNTTDRHLAARLASDDPNRLDSYRIESEIVENFKRVYYFAKRIAKIAIDTSA